MACSMVTFQASTNVVNRSVEVGSIGDRSALATHRNMASSFFWMSAADGTPPGYNRHVASGFALTGAGMP